MKKKNNAGYCGVGDNNTPFPSSFCGHVSDGDVSHSLLPLRFDVETGRMSGPIFDRSSTTHR